MYSVCFRNNRTMSDTEVKEPREVFVDDWRKAWAEGRNKWHLDHIHP